MEEELDEWIKVTVDEDEGYVSKEFVDLALELPKAATLSEVTGVSDNRSSLVAYAKQFIGNPYVWGGTSLTKGADCSGFVLSVYKKYGISRPIPPRPRPTAAQGSRHRRRSRVICSSMARTVPSTT